MGSSSSSFSGAYNECETERGIFKCDEGSQAFYAKHALQHRQTFTDQYTQVPVERDVHQQMFPDCTDQRFYLMDEIDQWEQESIDRIRRTAGELRRQVKTSADEFEKTVSNELEDVTEGLCKVQQNEDFTESVDKRKLDLSAISSSLTLREDPANVFIPKLCLISTAPQFVHNESLVCVSGDAEITDDGHAAKNVDTWVDVQVQGKGEYSVGIHKLRFIIGSKSPYFHSYFGIVSKFTPRSQKLSDVSWTGEKILDGPYRWQTLNHGQRSTNEETMLEITLTIDCENEIIRCLNERTNKTKEMSIDTSEWPFPWQLSFGLTYMEDHVQLLSSDRA